MGWGLALFLVFATAVEAADGTFEQIDARKRAIADLRILVDNFEERLTQLQTLPSRPLEREEFRASFRENLSYYYDLLHELTASVARDAKDESTNILSLSSIELNLRSVSERATQKTRMDPLLSKSQAEIRDFPFDWYHRADLSNPREFAFQWSRHRNVTVPISVINKIRSLEQFFVLRAFFEEREGTARPLNAFMLTRLLERVKNSTQAQVAMALMASRKYDLPSMVSLIDQLSNPEALRRFARARNPDFASLRDNPRFQRFMNFHDETVLSSEGCVDLFEASAAQLRRAARNAERLRGGR
jgi:hypothetical protein